MQTSPFHSEEMGLPATTCVHMQSNLVSDILLVCVCAYYGCQQTLSSL